MTDKVAVAGSLVIAGAVLAGVMRAAEPPPTGRDDMGATALMRASAVSALSDVRVLLDKGADPNAVSSGGATALMWSTGDPAKVRLLLDRGATANVTTKDGDTALVTAARRGNVDVMRLLLAHGADPATSPQVKAELLRIAYNEHPAIRQLLSDAGLQLDALARSGTPSLANYPMSNADAVRALLELGASPNPRGRFPVLALAAFQGQLNTARVLLEHGADPNAKGQQDATPLMMAAAAPRPDPDLVRLLLDHGADISAHDRVGRTALDWALTQGDTQIVRLLRQAGASSAYATPASPAATTSPRSPRAAIEAALTKLQPTGPVLYERRKCIACHQQTLPLMATVLARGHDIVVNPEAATNLTKSIVDTWKGRREDLMLGHEVAGGANELTYGLLAFAESDMKPNDATNAAVVNLITLQADDGSWVFWDTRSPQADNSRIPFTAMAVRGLSVYGPPGLRHETDGIIARAREYLRRASPNGTQDEAFKLLGLVWARVPRAEIAAQTARLVALQRDDGGWGQLPTLTSDAYATGEALYALQASSASVKGSAYPKGVTFLLRSQLADGTWFVRSRAFGFQPYFETGFPHGTDQFISASATAWAAIALSFAL
jgi:ankyrin repeat protein